MVIRVFSGTSGRGNLAVNFANDAAAPTVSANRNDSSSRDTEYQLHLKAVSPDIRASLHHNNVHCVVPAAYVELLLTALLHRRWDSEPYSLRTIRPIILHN